MFKVILIVLCIGIAHQASGMFRLKLSRFLKINFFILFIAEKPKIRGLVDDTKNQFDKSMHHAQNQFDDSRKQAKEGFENARNQLKQRLVRSSEDTIEKLGQQLRSYQSQQDDRKQWEEEKKKWEEEKKKWLEQRKYQ